MSPLQSALLEWFQFAGMVVTVVLLVWTDYYRRKSYKSMRERMDSLSGRMDVLGDIQEIHRERFDNLTRNLCTAFASISRLEKIQGLEPLVLDELMCEVKVDREGTPE